MSMAHGASFKDNEIMLLISMKSFHYKQLKDQNFTIIHIKTTVFFTLIIMMLTKWDLKSEFAFYTNINILWVKCI